MLGDKFIGSLVAAENGVHEYFKLRPSRDLFRGPEASLFTFVDQYIQRYGEFPTPEAFDNALKAHDIELLPESGIAEPPQYYLDQLKERQMHRALKSAIEKAAEDLNSGNVKTAYENITSTVMDMHFKSNRGKIVNYTEDAEEIIRSHLLSVQRFDDYGLKLGWPSFDEVSGGLQGGDMVSIVGRPAMGKTFLSLYSMLHAWSVQNKRCVFISMEMKPSLIVERLAAMDAGVSLSEIKTGAIPTKRQKDLMGKLVTNQGGTPLYLVDGSLSATVEDIGMFCRQFNAEAVFIDGGYLIRNSGRMARWERISDTAERVKGDIAEELDIPAVVSYQLNRDSTKSKTKEGLQHIAGADAIGQVSSAVLALLQDESEGPSTKVERIVSILKGRHGEVGEFKINWSFNRVPFMDFREIRLNDDRELDHL